MNLEPYRISAPAVTGYGMGWIEIDGRRIDASVVLQSTGTHAPWNCALFADLSAAHFAQLAQTRPGVLLFGSGARLRFPKSEWLRSLIEQGIGIETMDTPAACRTYNLLAGEGRHVVAALLVERGPEGRSG